MISLILITAFAGAGEVLVVPNVDLTRYAGRWFEVASIPQFFQRHCVADVHADYARLDDGSVKVVNACRRADGSVSSAEGRARVVDAAVPAKLQVTFVRLFTWIYAFGGDYWIIDLDQDYRFAVIGHPKRTYAWILSRTPTLAPAVLKGIEGRLADQGYDTCQVLTTAQGESRVARTPLCRAVRE